MFEESNNRLTALLRWSERYTKVDMVYLVRGGALLTSADVVLAVVSLGLSVLIAAYVPKDIYGIYRYVLAITTTVGIFSLTGMNSAVTRAVALGREGVFARSLIVQGRYALLQLAAAGTVAAYYFFMGNATYGIAFTLVALIAPISGVCNTYTAFLNGRKDFARLTSWRIQSGLLNIAAMATVVLTSPTIILLTLAYFLSTLLSNIWFLWRTFRNYHPGREVDAEDLSYGKHLSVMNGIGTFSGQLDLLLVYHLLGPVSLATYAFAILIPERLRVLLNFLPNLLLPRLAGQTREMLRASAKHRVWLLLVATLAMAGAYALAAPFIFSVFFPAYAEAVPYSIFAGLIVVTAAQKYFATALTAEGSYRSLYYLSVITPIVKIVLSVICISLFGIWGALGARLAASVFGGVLGYLFL